jgi:hypothetical protein
MFLPYQVNFRAASNDSKHQTYPNKCSATRFMSDTMREGIATVHTQESLNLFDLKMRYQHRPASGSIPGLNIAQPVTDHPIGVRISGHSHRVT